MVNKMPRRRQSDILQQETDAFLTRFGGVTRRINPYDRRRVIRKRRLKKELKGIVKNPLFFEEAQFAQVWREHRAWTLESNAFDYDTFAQQYVKTTKRLLTRELKSMNGDGASIKVLPVINFVVGSSEEADTPEAYAEIMRQGYAQPTWRRNSVLPNQNQYLGTDRFNLIYEEHWEVTQKLDLQGLEGTAIHNERDIANYANRLVEGIVNKVENVLGRSGVFFVRGNWLNLKVSKFYS